MAAWNGCIGSQPTSATVQPAPSLQEAVAAAGQQCVALQQQEVGVRAEIEAVGREKYEVRIGAGGRAVLLVEAVPQVGRQACPAPPQPLGW